jgi:hypothetical protein
VTSITRISKGSAAFELGRNAMNLSVYRERALPLLADLVTEAKCFHMIHGDLDEAVEAIRLVTSPDQTEKTPTNFDARSPA